MKLVKPPKYKNLKIGGTYFFESFTITRFADDVGKPMVRILPTGICREGKLLKIHTKWRNIRNKKGKMVDKELVGDTVRFVPVDDIMVTESGERLKIYEVSICNGLYRLYEPV